MLTYDLGKRGEKRLYEYLYECIRGDILSGRLAAGTALPSKRALARQLSVSVITVETAYAQLLTEGYVYSEPRKGFFVSELEIPLGQDRSRNQEQSGRMADHGTAAGRDPGAGCSSADCLPAGGSSAAETVFADFSSNQMPIDSFPFATWARLSRRVLSDRQEQLMRNTPSGGAMELRSAIAGHLQAFRGISVSPEQVIIGAGTEYLYGLLIQLLGFDLTYAVENPGYSKVSQVFHAYGVDTVSIDLDGSGMRSDLLEQYPANVVHITPSDHFPTGITMPVARRYEMLSWAAMSDDRYIIEDDYDSELRMNGRPLPALCSIDRDGRVIYMNTFSKSLASTIRISYMVLPRKLLERFRQKLSFYSCTVPTFEQYTLASFISEGYYEKHINRMRNASRKRKDLLMSVISDSRLRPIAAIQENSEGMHFLLNLRLGIPTDQFMRNLAAGGIRMRPLDSYRTRQPVASEDRVRGGSGPEQDVTQTLLKLGDGLPEHTFVINFSSVPAGVIPEAVERIARASGR